MKKRNCLLTSLMLVLFYSCNSQTERREQIVTTDSEIVGGPCESCDIMYVGMPEKISSEHTGPGWNEDAQKLLLTGRVMEPDGKTPAANVIVYYWHTGPGGLYNSDATSLAAAKRHGRYRGWVKTDSTGVYTIRTSRPGAYPNEVIPQHIHLLIKEPDLNNMYYADLYFDDDPLYLPHQKKNGRDDRAGSEVLRVVTKDNVQAAEHNIILGMNIPNYPQPAKENISGLRIGEDQPSFIPYHAFGPDKGSRACPVCKYGRYHGVILFAGTNCDWSEIKNWLSFLEKQSIQRGKYLKVYFVYANSEQAAAIKKLEELGNSLHLERIALTWVSSFSDRKSEVYLNKIPATARNSIVIYKNRSITERYVDLPATEDNFRILADHLDKTRSPYFEWSADVKH